MTSRRATNNTIYNNALRDKKSQQFEDDLEIIAQKIPYKGIDGKTGPMGKNGVTGCTGPMGVAGNLE
jgi:hypothetical protein